jgi:hypothetical protein
MADLTQNSNLRFLGGMDNVVSEKWYIDTSVANKFFEGQGVMIDQSADTVNATPFVDAITVLTTDVCLGVAAEGKTVVLGDPETTEIEVYVGPTVVGFPSTVFANGDIGKLVYQSDSGTLSATGTANFYLGKLEKVEDGYCYVLLAGPALNSAA